MVSHYCPLPWDSPGHKTGPKPGPLRTDTSLGALSAVQRSQEGIHPVACLATAVDPDGPMMGRPIIAPTPDRESVHVGGGAKMLVAARIMHTKYR